MKLPAFKLEQFFAKYEFKAPYLLCSSDCESLSIDDLLSLEPDAEKTFGRQWLGYTESPGNPELRQEIARTYQQIDASEVLVHAGAEEAIFIFMNVVLEPGDHIIVHSPCYQSLVEIARTIGCEVSTWMANEDNSWELDIDFLRRNIQDSTKAIIINCPHNPTGYVISHAKLRQIVELARQHNMLAFF